HGWVGHVDRRRVVHRQRALGSLRRDRELDPGMAAAASAGARRRDRAPERRALYRAASPVGSKDRAVRIAAREVTPAPLAALTAGRWSSPWRCLFPLVRAGGEVDVTEAMFVIVPLLVGWEPRRTVSKGGVRGARRTFRRGRCSNSWFGRPVDVV